MAIIGNIPYFQTNPFDDFIMWRQRRGRLWDWRQSDEVNLKLWSTVKKVTSAHLGVASRCHKCLLKGLKNVHFTKGVKSCLYKKPYYTILYQRNTATTSRQEKTWKTCPLNEFKGQRPKHSEQDSVHHSHHSSLDCCMAMRCHRSATMCDHMFSVS